MALSPGGTVGYVANTVSGTVTVLEIKSKDPKSVVVKGTIRVGTEPYALVLTPNGRELYVANARSNSISVIDTYDNRVVKTIEQAGFEPRGMACCRSSPSRRRFCTMASRRHWKRSWRT